MYVKQIDQNTALDLCKKGVEVKVLMADNDRDWKGMIPDTLQNVLDGCMFFREEPAVENQEFGKALGADPKSPPPPPDSETAGSVGAGAKRKKVDTGKLLALHRAGWSGKKIAEELKVSEATVSSYLKKMEEAR